MAAALHLLWRVFTQTGAAVRLLGAFFTKTGLFVRAQEEAIPFVGWNSGGESVEDAVSPPPQKKINLMPGKKYIIGKFTFQNLQPV
jgi:hypothetical protein